MNSSKQKRDNEDLDTDLEQDRDHSQQDTVVEEDTADESEKSSQKESIFDDDFWDKIFNYKTTEEENEDDKLSEDVHTIGNNADNEVEKELDVVDRKSSGDDWYSNNGTFAKEDDDIDSSHIGTLKSWDDGWEGWARQSNEKSGKNSFEFTSKNNAPDNKPGWYRTSILLGDIVGKLFMVAMLGIGVGIKYAANGTYRGMKYVADALSDPGLYKKSLLLLLLLWIIFLGVYSYSLYESNRQCYGNKIVLAKTYFDDPILIKVDDDKRGHDLLTRGYMDGNITRAMSKFVSPGDSVIDVGAGFGYYTLYLSRLVGDKGRVFSIEAKAKVFNIMRYSLRLNPTAKNVYAYNATIYSSSTSLLTNNNENKVIALNQADNNKSSKVQSAERVQSYSLSDLLHEVSNVKLLHINACYNEDDILLGAGALIARSPDIKIITSWCGQKGNARAVKALRELSNSGFHFWFLSDSGAVPLNKIEEVMAIGDKYPLLISKTKL